MTWDDIGVSMGQLGLSVTLGIQEMNSAEGLGLWNLYGIGSQIGVKQIKWHVVQVYVGRFRSPEPPGGGTRQFFNCRGDCQPWGVENRDPVFKLTSAHDKICACLTGNTLQNSVHVCIPGGGGF